MNVLYTESIEFLTAVVFYGLYFGMLAALVRPLYDWFRRF